MSSHIKCLDLLPDAIEEKMKQGFIEYESSKGVDVNYNPFSLVLTNDNGRVIGVLKAYTAFSEIYIDDLWVDREFRGKGYGRKLVRALEERFTGQGFNNINLVTSQFQAPDFYRKCGFSVEFIRKNSANPQLTKTFFIKYFNEKKQTQGLLNPTNSA